MELFVTLIVDVSELRLSPPFHEIVCCCRTASIALPLSPRIQFTIFSYAYSYSELSLFLQSLDANLACLEILNVLSNRWYNPKTLHHLAAIRSQMKIGSQKTTKIKQALTNWTRFFPVEISKQFCTDIWVPVPAIRTRRTSDGRSPKKNVSFEKPEIL